MSLNFKIEISFDLKPNINNEIINFFQILEQNKIPKQSRLTTIPPKVLELINFPLIDVGLDYMPGTSRTIIRKMYRFNIKEKKVFRWTVNFRHYLGDDTSMKMVSFF